MHLPARFPCRWLAVLLLAVLSVAKLTAQDSPPVIATDPQTQTVTAGQNVTLNVTANGTAPLAYRWWFESLPIITGTNSSLALTAVDALDSGSYRVVVTNAFGSVTSAPAVLTVVGPPIILEGPTNVTVYVGQSATFSVLAFSRPTNSTYQWLYQGNTLPNATNRTLTLVDVATNNAGFYSVQVKNGNGTATSFPGELTVLPLPLPALRLGVITLTNRIRVPVLYTAYGIETNISFSAAWDPAVYTNPSFEPELDLVSTNVAGSKSANRLRPASLPASSVVTVDETQAASGRLGIQIAWDPGMFLPPGESSIGQLVFDPVQGLDTAYSGRLSLTNLPVASVVAPPVLGQTNIILNGINPQVILAGIATLDRQTGFLQQSIRFVNPGNVFADNARLTVSGLEVDSYTNAIALANAQGYLLPDFLPYVDFGAIAPTEVRDGVLQYYVTDRSSHPTPNFNMFATPTNNYPVLSGTVLTATVRRTNDLVLVEFPTIPLYRYYIQYASSLTNLQAGIVETSLPYLDGTGSNRQWVDSGPPRTLPAADNGALRFYRVLEVR